MTNTEKALFYLTPDVIYPTETILRNNGIYVFDYPYIDNPFPYTEDPIKFVEKIISIQIEKMFLEPYGLQTDFYILFSTDTQSKNFKHIKTSIFSTIYWEKQLQVPQLIQSWQDNQKVKQNQCARICIIGKWRELNSYPSFFYDALKYICKKIGIIPNAQNVFLESDFFKYPFGRAFNNEYLYDKFADGSIKETILSLKEL